MQVLLLMYDLSRIDKSMAFLIESSPCRTRRSGSPGKSNLCESLPNQSFAKSLARQLSLTESSACIAGKVLMPVFISIHIDHELEIVTRYLTTPRFFLAYCGSPQDFRLLSTGRQSYSYHIVIRFYRHRFGSLTIVLVERQPSWQAVIAEGRSAGIYTTGICK
jgi:hypothetical protein